MNYELLLQEKVKRELKEYRQQKLKQDKIKIFDSAYEIMSVEDFAGVLNSYPLKDEQIKKLLKCKNLLIKLYEHWFDNDHPVVEVQTSALENFIKGL